MPFEYFIGGRYLKSRQKQGFISFISALSMAGVTVGVMALIIVIAVMSGAESFFKSKILGVEPHIVVRQQGERFENYREVINTIASEIDVRSVAPFMEAQVMLRSARGMSGAMLRGLDPDYDGTEIMGLPGEKLEEKLVAGKEGEDGYRVPGIVIGKNLADRLGVREGDKIFVISQRGILSPAGHMPAMSRFAVTGIFASGFHEYDASLAYIHLEAAQNLLKAGDSVSGLGIKIDDIYRADALSGQIQETLGFQYWALDWMELNRNFFQALKLEKEVMFIILTLIILVAAFNIASTLIMLVMSKTKDIAILKAMGATDASIRKIFVFKGMIIGVIGTCLGTVLGIGGSLLLKHYKFIELPGDVYYFTSLPVQLEIFDIATIVGAAMSICFLATLYPAHKASRLNPVEALRYG
ncbi:MAG: lipoprotein-releasing ABC transporter permease subunit [Desulfosalsimonadaceae bacterium]